MITEKQIESDRLKIGRRIAELREENSMSQSDLAKLVGMERQGISRIELGTHSTGIDILNKICRALKAKLEITNQK